MAKAFNALIDSFIDNKVGLGDGFLSTELAAQLTANLLSMYAQQKFSAAGIGDNKLVNYDQQFRGDEIYWLDRIHDNASENAFFDVMDQFVAFLNEACYTGITSYEFHYALYGVGTFYKKHLDQFRGKDTRKYSMILYLNENGVVADGGELCIHHANHMQTIAPQLGTSVFFQSNALEHEVLPTTKQRLSITGWLKC